MTVCNRYSFWFLINSSRPYKTRLPVFSVTFWVELGTFLLSLDCWLICWSLTLIAANYSDCLLKLGMFRWSAVTMLTLLSFKFRPCTLLRWECLRKVDLCAIRTGVLSICVFLSLLATVRALLCFKSTESALFTWLLLTRSCSETTSPWSRLTTCTEIRDGFLRWGFCLTWLCLGSFVDGWESRMLSGFRDGYYLSGDN